MPKPKCAIMSPLKIVRLALWQHLRGKIMLDYANNSCLYRDTLFMLHCIDLAWRTQTLTLPNPPVSALLLDKNYEIISVGLHLKAGKAHAEVLALLRGYEVLNKTKSGLDESSDSKQIHDFLLQCHNGLFRDKILLITLEPCNHYGKTPPCAKLLSELKPAKVIIAFKDKWGKSSNGAKTLQKAGVQVEMLAQSKMLDSSEHIKHKILDLLYPFLCLKERGRFNLFKLALRLNGEYKDGQISGRTSRNFTHNQRCIAQNLIISGRTAIKDKPRLDTRYASDFYALDSAMDSKINAVLDSTQSKSNLAQNLPNVEILTRNPKAIMEQSSQIPLFSQTNRQVSIKTSPNELSLHNGFNIIEGGFPLLETLQNKIDILLLHFSPAILQKSSDTSHDNALKQLSTKSNDNVLLQNLLRRFEILHTTILDDSLVGLFMQYFTSNSDNINIQNTKTTKIDSNKTTKKTAKKRIAKSQDLLVWLKPIT